MVSSVCGEIFLSDVFEKEEIIALISLINITKNDVFAVHYVWICDSKTIVHQQFLSTLKKNLFGKQLQNARIPKCDPGYLDNDIG